MALTNALANTILTTNFTSASTWLALHVSDPTNAGLASTELTTTVAPTYTRRAISWGTPANRSVANSSIVSWVGLPILSVGYLGCWSASSGGTLLAVFTCARPLTVASSGGSLYLPVGGISITLAGSPEGRLTAIPTDPFAVYTEDPLNPGVFQ